MHQIMFVELKKINSQVKEAFHLPKVNPLVMSISQHDIWHAIIRCNRSMRLLDSSAS